MMEIRQWTEREAKNIDKGYPHAVELVDTHWIGFSINSETARRLRDITEGYENTEEYLACSMKSGLFDAIERIERIGRQQSILSKAPNQQEK